jgi:hypothetical protein
MFGPYLVTLSLSWAKKTPFRAGRHENKEKSLFYFGLRIRLPIQIQLLDIEKKSKKSKNRLPLLSRPAAFCI